MNYLPNYLRQFAIGLILLSVLVGCSMPDGPDPEDIESQTSETPEMTEAPEITLNGPGQILPITATADIKGEQFDLEVAVGSQQQALGLMFRSALPDNRGMLFPFAAPRRASFWMRDVPVALDMVFMRDGEVVEVFSQVPPCPALPCPSYGPDGALVDQVLELRSGRAAELGLGAGDRITIQPIEPIE